MCTKSCKAPNQPGRPLTCLRPRSRIAHRDGPGWPLSDGCRFFESDRQAHGKDRTFTRLARDRHVAAHQARELAGNGKAETRAPETLCSRGIGLAELLEPLRLLLRCHADP